MNLNQVTVPSLDVSKSIEFYQKLGLKLIVHSSDHYARFLCPDGDSTFSVSLVDQIGKRESSSHYERPVIYFECAELDEKVKELSKIGVEFIEMPNDKEWAWREAHLKDPFDNQIILYTAGENRINPPWRLKD